MESKNIVFSKTAWGIVIMAIAPILNHFHISLGSEDADALAQAAASAVGAGLALYGRIKAHQPVHVIPPAPPEQPKV